MGWPLSRGRADRRSAKNRNTWFPVSAQECAASAAIEADPDRTAATDLAAATRILAANAMMTVSSVELDLDRSSVCAMRLPYPPARLPGAGAANQVPGAVPAADCQCPL